MVQLSLLLAAACAALGRGQRALQRWLAAAAGGATARAGVSRQQPAQPPLVRGSFVVRTPAFFDCTGPAFPPVWDEYYEAVSAWERQLHLALGAQTGVWTLSPELRELVDKVSVMSHDLLAQWFPSVSEKSGTGLDKVIRRYWPEESLEGVCYYGLVQCLWIRAQFLLMQAAPHIAEAMMELRTAMQILGEDFRGDYIESTRWPVHSLEIQLSLQRERLTKVPTLKQVINMHYAPVSAASSPGAEFFAPDGRGDVGAMELHVAAFGAHVALLSEPVTMIRGAFPDWHVVGHWFLSECRRQDPLHHYLCRLNCMLIGECEFREHHNDLGRRLLKLVDFAAENVGDPDDLEEAATFPRLLDLMADLWEGHTDLRMSNLAVCTIPLVCSLLRAVTPLPVVGYFAMTHYMAAAAGIGDWGMAHFAEMAKNTRQNAFAASCPLISELGAYQMGLHIPVVRPFGLYAYRDRARLLFPSPFASLDANTGSYSRTVVVPRSWLAQETSFLHALRAFVDVMEPFCPLNFTVVRSMTGTEEGDPNIAVNPPERGERLGDLLSHGANVFLDSKAMLLYRAAVMLPQLPNMMSFYELHSMHLPTFIPGRAWLYRLYQQRRWIGFGPPKLTAQVRPMKAPLFDATVWNTNDTLAHWIFLYDRRFEVGLPGVHMFESFPDLLDKLLYADLQGIREDMRRHNEEAFGPTLQWYRSAVLHLLQL